MVHFSVVGKTDGRVQLVAVMTGRLNTKGAHTTNLTLDDSAYHTLVVTLRIRERTAAEEQYQRVHAPTEVQGRMTVADGFATLPDFRWATEGVDWTIHARFPVLAVNEHCMAMSPNRLEWMITIDHKTRVTIYPLFAPSARCTLFEGLWGDGSQVDHAIVYGNYLYVFVNHSIRVYSIPDEHEVAVFPLQYEDPALLDVTVDPTTQSVILFRNDWATWIPIPRPQRTKVAPGSWSRQGQDTTPAETKTAAATVANRLEEKKPSGSTGSSAPSSPFSSSSSTSDDSLFSSRDGFPWD
jgi:hypothetical protein